MPFDSATRKVWKTFNGNITKDLITNINNEMPNGGTNIYQCVYDGFKILQNTDNNFNKTIILMTDGNSVSANYTELSSYYINNNLDIPANFCMVYIKVLPFDSSSLRICMYLLSACCCQTV